MASTDIPKLNILTSTMMGKYKNLIFGLALAAVVGLAIAAFSFYQYQKTQKELQAIKKTMTSSQKANNDQVTKIVAEVGKIMKLPEGELPTMATISDIAKLKDQPFFQNGKNGDILLVYNQAGKAILYNPTDKRVVEVAPVGSASPSPSIRPGSSPTPTPQPIPAKVILRNGTIAPNLASKIETEIKKSFSNITVVGKENAARDTYDKTTVVIINQAAKDTALNLAKNLTAIVSDLPSAEKKTTDADILIILGKDKI